MRGAAGTDLFSVQFSREANVPDSERKNILSVARDSAYLMLLNLHPNNPREMQFGELIAGANHTSTSH